MLEARLLRPASATYEWLELEVRTDAACDNPFDPQEVELWAVFDGPGGPRRAHGFWYQGFERRLEAAPGARAPAGGRQALTPAGAPGWRIRFTPTAPGRYTCRIHLRDRTGAVAATAGPAFEVAPGSHPGFVGISRRDPAYFAYAGGGPFLPIGENIGWGNDGRTYDYDAWCGRLAAAGGNFIRVWMATWCFGIEAEDTGPGQYTARLDRAWELDHVLALCERLGIQVMLCLVNHGAVSTWCNPEWDRHAYNAANPGGFLTGAEQFFTDARARELFRRRLRYIVARWGHSPSLMAWELFNEVDLTDGWKQCKAAVGEWHGEMARHIRGLDPYGHLISSSYMGDTRDPLLWHLPELDFVQYHTYGHQDLAPHIAQAARELGRYGCPVCVAEFGTDTTGADTADQAGVWLREGLWAALLGKAAGPAWPWWWDSCIHPLDLYGHWAAIARFVAGERPDAEGYVPVRPECQGAEAYALVGPRRALLWLKNPAWTWSAAPGPYPPAAGVAVRLPLPPGTWHVEWWDPATGLLAGAETAGAGSDGLVLRRPTLPEDIAAKVWR